MSDLEAAGGRDADLAYLRVADDIAARIASGERARLITTIHGRGTFVRKD